MSPVKNKVYPVWNAMMARCNNPKDKAYKYYGDRGIKVCKRWNKFNNFLEDMGYPNGLTLDRINNDGNYEPKNCRWATRSEQSHNKRAFGISKYHGINKCKISNKWRARICVNKKLIHLGLYKDEETAAECYDMARYLLLGIKDCPNRKVLTK